MLTLENQNNAHAEIDYIFTKLLPQQGMPERPAQIELSHRMLDAMLSGKTALCEAGTGIGKTCAYLVAACIQHRYRTLEGIQSVSVPQMQIKLRQGFGRAIRKETDTCAVAILDERAALGGRYHRAVMEALPELPLTGDIHRVERFIRKVKPKEYFEEAHKLKCDDTRRKES